MNQNTPSKLRGPSQRSGCRSRLRLACLLATVFATTNAFANSYEIVDLGAGMFPTGIDSKGEMSAVLVRGHERAMVYSGGKWRHAPSGHRRAKAVAVSRGRVAGNIDGTTPVIWVHHDQPQVLALPPGSRRLGTATGINADGDISGYFSADTGKNHCFLWSFATALSENLGFLNDGDSCEAYGIDKQGRVYGRANAQPGNRWFGFVWHQGRMHSLPPLIAGGSSFARAGNKSGKVVGWSTSRTDWGEYQDHAVVWSNGEVQDLFPTDYWQSRAYGIDDNGTIIGRGTENAGDDPGSKALRFEGGRQITLITEVVNREDWYLSTADAISPDGLIVGIGWRRYDVSHGYLLIPR